jgi:hypothetical protein
LPSAVSVAIVKSSLVVDALDAGVGVGLLMLVDPSGWDPFGEPVGVDAAAPAFLQEVGVVVSAEQGQIVNTALNVPAWDLAERASQPNSRARPEVEAPTRTLDGTEPRRDNIIP